MIERYYLKADHEREWSNVTREQFIAAEQAAGFRSKFGFNHPATSGFSGSGMRGRIVYVTEQPRPEQVATGSASICECSHPRSEHVLSTGPRDRCGGTTERGTPCRCPKYTLRKGDYDAPAAPERGEWTPTPWALRSSGLIVGNINGNLRYVARLEHTDDQGWIDGKRLIDCVNQRSTLIAQRERLIQTLQAACGTLKSYQYGNVSPELAKEMIRTIGQVLTTIEQEGTEKQ